MHPQCERAFSENIRKIQMWSLEKLCKMLYPIIRYRCANLLRRITDVPNVKQTQTFFFKIIFAWGVHYFNALLKLKAWLNYNGIALFVVFTTVLGQDFLCKII